MKERIREIFAEVLEVDHDMIVDSLAYSAIPQWDSVAHMAIVAAVEDEYDIMMEIDDIIDMNTFETSVSIIQKYIN
jgi:acyl carrier protein